ncbi:hypothetical protein [Pigmentiphaga sp. CHJ604]|uniref:hypothetical protein n=1 Tax=Pigmentiphaga sp. CHJ604 TaxID=3081984 RepID=UPI0030D419F9
MVDTSEKNRLSVACYLYSALIFVSMQPFFVWNSPEIAFSLIALLFSLSILLRGSLRRPQKQIFSLLIIATFFFLYVAAPFRLADSLSIRPIAYSYALIVGVYYFGGNITTSWKILKNIFVVISAISLVSMIFLTLGAPFPSITISQNFRPQESDQYILYYGMSYLSSQISNFGGLTIVRNSGWFGEPGHFGIYIVLLLATEERLLASKSNKLLFLTLLSTLSLGSYISFLVLFLIRERRFGSLVFLSLVCLVFYILARDLIDNFLLSKLLSDQPLLQARADFSLDLQAYTPAQLIFGSGRDYLTSLNEYSSNWDAFAAKYGLLAIAIFLFSVFYILKTSFKFHNALIGLGVATIAIIIMLHRSWMIDTLYLWSAFFVIVYKMRNKSPSPCSSE